MSGLIAAALRAKVAPPPKDVSETYTSDDLARVWDEGHKDVCTDCNCPSSINPYLNAPPPSIVEQATEVIAEAETEWQYDMNVRRATSIRKSAPHIAARLQEAGLLKPESAP